MPVRFFQSLPFQLKRFVFVPFAAVPSALIRLLFHKTLLSFLNRKNVERLPLDRMLRLTLPMQQSTLHHLDNGFALQLPMYERRIAVVFLLRKDALLPAMDDLFPITSFWEWNDPIVLECPTALPKFFQVDIDRYKSQFVSASASTPVPSFHCPKQTQPVLALPIVRFGIAVPSLCAIPPVKPSYHNPTPSLIGGFLAKSKDFLA